MEDVPSHLIISSATIDYTIFRKMIYIQYTVLLYMHSIYMLYIALKMVLPSPEHFSILLAAFKNLCSPPPTYIIAQTLPTLIQLNFLFSLP